MKRGLMGQYAGFGSRALALILDVVLIYALQFVITWIVITFLDVFRINVNNCGPLTNGRDVINLVCYSFQFLLIFFNLTFSFIYFTFFWIFGGQTIGNYVMGLRVLRLDGKRMTVFRSFLRYTGYFISLIALGMGFFWALGSDRRQGWHDLLARTCVLYAWEAVPDEHFLVRADKRLDKRFGIKPNEQPAGSDEST